MQITSKIISAILLLAIICLVFCVVFWGDNPSTSTPSPSPSLTSELKSGEETINENEMIVVEPNGHDIWVLPDKYNTGVNEKVLFDEISGPGVYNGVSFSESGTSDLILSFKRNKNLSGTIEFENVDFTLYRVRTYDECFQEVPLTVVFSNCKFSKFLGPQTGNINVNYLFNNCSFNYCAVSNAEFNRCYFGKDISDGLVPFNNVYVNNCYFSDMCMQSSTERSGVHTDGTQIYGSKDSGCCNIHYVNCRFEIPNLKNNVNNVNACIMLQIEFADANNISFKNCYANGGGYTIYARTARDGTITDAVINDIKIGVLHEWGKGRDIFICPDVDPNIEIENVMPADSVYVGSVWRESGKLLFSVSNDTNIDRTLLVITNNSKHLYNIRYCYEYDQLTDETSFEDLPFDMLYSFEDLCDWAVFYDVTDMDNVKQVRCVNYSSNLPRVLKSDLYN